jgi:DNA polymerase-3 subunit beta
MELSIERNELLAGLYLVQGVVERRTTIPILANVLLQANDGTVTLSATDNEVGIRRLCTASAKKKGAITTGARRLYEMVREFPEGEIRIRSLENHWIEVSAGRSRFRLMGLDPREFPAIPEPSAAAREQTIRLSAAVLSEMIEYTLFAVSGDETRANLNGIFVESVEPGRLRMVATDGHRLAMVTRSVERAELAKGIILARKSIMELRKVIEGAAEETVAICVDGGVAHAERGPIQLSMRLVEGEFPDYQQVVPAKSENVAEVPNARLAAALRRVSIVSSERTRGVKLQFQDHKLELSSINPDVGEGVEEVELEYDGPAVAIGFNARYLIDALAVLPADNPIQIGLNDDVSPGVIRQGGDPDYCYIVMPMRL